MGAELWYHQAPWRPEPEVALRALQARFVADYYDLPALLSEHLDSVRQAVALTEAQGDPHGQLGNCQERFQLLQQLSAQPIPADPAGQIDIIREIKGFGGLGVGNVLDVTRVSDQRNYPSAERLSDTKMIQLLGTIRPTADGADEAVDKINDELSRGQAICFPIYKEAGGEPVGWFFVGNTID